MTSLPSCEASVQRPQGEPLTKAVCRNPSRLELRNPRRTDFDAWGRRDAAVNLAPSLS